MQLCDSPPGIDNDENSISSTIYSTPVAHLGSTNDLASAAQLASTSQQQHASSVTVDDKNATPISTKSSKANNKNITSNNDQQSSRQIHMGGEGHDAMQGEGSSLAKGVPSMTTYQSPKSQRRSGSAARSKDSVRSVM